LDVACLSPLFSSSHLPRACVCETRAKLSASCVTRARTRRWR
jgi:hypothetical protein